MFFFCFLFINSSTFIYTQQSSQNQCIGTIYLHIRYINLNLDSIPAFIHSYLNIHHLQSIQILHSPWDQKVVTKGFATENFWRIIFAANSLSSLRGDNQRPSRRSHSPWIPNLTRVQENLAIFYALEQKEGSSAISIFLFLTSSIFSFSRSGSFCPHSYLVIEYCRR